MSEQGDTEVQARLIEVEYWPGIPIGKRLRLHDSDGQRAVYFGPTPIHVYDIADKEAEAACIATLSRAGLASDVAIANGFGVHRNTVGRISARFAREGMAAVVPAKRGPKAPHKLTEEAMALIASHAGLPVKDLRAKVAAATGIWVSVSHLYRLSAPYRPVQGELAESEGAEDSLTASGGADEADDAQRHLVTAVEQLPEDALAARSSEHGGEQGPSDHCEHEDAERASRDDEQCASDADDHDDEQADHDEAPATGEEPAGFDPPPELPEVSSGSCMGLALYFPALAATGLLEAARAIYRLPRSATFGVRAVLSCLFFMTVCSASTLEAAKHLRRWDFGPLIGAPRAPCVKTLRRKLAELVTQSKAALLSVTLARHWVDTGLVHTAYLYVDGHVKAYSGKKKLEEVYDTKAQRPVRGLHSYFVGDQDGRPLLFVTEEISPNLAKAMPRIIEAIREVLGDRAFTIIFDRGGYDGKMFSWLVSKGVQFITYQRGSVCLPKEAFRRHQVRFEGRRLRFHIAEDNKKVGRSGPFRRIVVRTKSGHQTPILTSLGPEVPPARIAALMFARWRQENFFKYAGQHHGLDDIVSYAGDLADPNALVPNPKRKSLDAALKDKRKKLAALKAELGDVVLDEPKANGRSAHGLKIAQGGKVGRLRGLEAEITSLVAERKLAPTHVTLAEAGIAREVLRHEAKAIMDRVKICAYNAEEWLLDRLVHHYGNAHDVRDLLRHFAGLPGEMRTSFAYGPDGIAIPTAVTVSLDPPDTPCHREALRGLVDDLNAAEAMFPGTTIPVTYRVRMHHSEQAA
jgi:transposase